MEKPAAEETSPLKALVDFECLDTDCAATVQCDLMDLENSKGKIACPVCRRPYHFDKAFRDKLRRFRELLVAIRNAEDLLGDASVGITTAIGEERIPYRLLLTRLNTAITLSVGDRHVDFRFRVEPHNGEFK